MNELRCTECQRLFAEEDLLTRENDGAKVCVDCSGLLTKEDLGCEYDEVG